MHSGNGTLLHSSIKKLIVETVMQRRWRLHGCTIVPELSDPVVICEFGLLRPRKKSIHSPICVNLGSVLERQRWLIGY